MVAALAAMIPLVRRAGTLVRWSPGSPRCFRSYARCRMRSPPNTDSGITTTEAVSSE